jgi:hypothetical protein
VRWVALFSFLATLGPVGAAAEDSPLDSARDAYERADFRSALAALEDLPATSAPDVRSEALELRATLLFALRDDGWREPLRELARLDPARPVSSRLPPQLRTELLLACAERTRPAEAILARARAAYVVADFEGTITRLSELPPALTAAQQVERLVLEALARFGLRDLRGTQRTLRRLASFAPDHEFGRQMPPSFIQAWRRARAES